MINKISNWRIMKDNFPANFISTVKTYILKQCKCGIILEKYHQGLSGAMNSRKPYKKLLSDYYCLNCFYSKLYKTIENKIKIPNDYRHSR
jgi:hypothetical protein